MLGAHSYVCFLWVCCVCLFVCLIKGLLTVSFSEVQVVRDFHCHKQKHTPIKTFPVEETFWHHHTDPKARFIATHWYSTKRKGERAPLEVMHGEENARNLFHPRKCHQPKGYIVPSMLREGCTCTTTFLFYY